MTEYTGVRLMAIRALADRCAIYHNEKSPIEDQIEAKQWITGHIKGDISYAHCIQILGFKDGTEAIEEIDRWIRRGPEYGGDIVVTEWRNS